jgi:hypothetical protein
MLLALVLAASVQCPPKLEIAGPFLAYGLGGWADLATTYHAELRGATEANPAVVYVTTYKAGPVLLKLGATAALTGGDVATQIGARKGLWPRWVKWVYRGGAALFLGSVAYHNSRQGPH